MLVLGIMILAGCGIEVEDQATATVPPLIITVTLPPTPTQQPSDIPLPIPSQPTTAPVEGITSTTLNVRPEPSTLSEVIGIVPANSIVKIVGKDIGESWWQILFDGGLDGKGWVSAQYVETTDRPEVPVIGSGEADAVDGNPAVVIQQLNIRSGPGTDFNSLGVLNANDIVNLSGKNRDGTWFQMEFAEGPDGKGWITASFVKTDDPERLPIISDTGELVGTSTPTGTPPPSTPTIVPAPMDFDSVEAPIKTVILEDAGTHTVLYNGDVSAPSGDREDWIKITPFTSRIVLEIACLGSNPHIDLINSGETLTRVAVIRCGIQEIISVAPYTPVIIHIRAPVEGVQTYSSYTIKVTTIQ